MRRSILTLRSTVLTITVAIVECDDHRARGELFPDPTSASQPCDWVPNGSFLLACTSCIPHRPAEGVEDREEESRVGVSVAEECDHARGVHDHGSPLTVTVTGADACKGLVAGPGCMQFRFDGPAAFLFMGAGSTCAASSPCCWASARTS